MKESSLLHSFPIEKIELAKAELIFYDNKDDIIKKINNIMIKSANNSKEIDTFLNSFSLNELELLKAEIELSKSTKELSHKLERIEKQIEKKPGTTINSQVLMEDLEPFPLDVEKVLRNNCIDNMEELLDPKTKLHGLNQASSEYIEFMKKFYDFRGIGDGDPTSVVAHSKNKLTK